MAGEFVNPEKVNLYDWNRYGYVGENYDYCLGNNVMEYYCRYDGSIVAKKISCDYGCSNVEVQ